MKVKFVSEKVKNLLSGIDSRKEKQSKRKKSLKYKGRAKELGEQRIAINIAQREVSYPSNSHSLQLLMYRLARSSKNPITTSLSKRKSSNLSNDPHVGNALKRTYRRHLRGVNRTFLDVKSVVSTSPSVMTSVWVVGWQWETV